MFRVLSRSLSRSSVCNQTIKERVRSFIINNPSLSESASAVSLASPPAASKELGQIQLSLLADLERVDVDYPTYRSAKINKAATRENPNLVHADGERMLHACVCYPHSHHASMSLLYRDYPVRCKCGHWFKLVSTAEYDKMREEKWNKIKEQPENAELMKTFEAAEAELTKLLEASKDMDYSTPGSEHVLADLARNWKQLREAYATIRKRSDF